MKKILDRTFQFFINLGRPFFPWREPKLLSDYEGLCKVLLDEGKKRVFVVIDHNLVKLGLHQALVVQLKDHGIRYHIFNEISPNPAISQVEKALSSYLAFGADSIIGFGGGSSIDVAKVLGARVVRPDRQVAAMHGLFKVRRKLPLFIAVPTTAGTGSEATLAAVIVDEKKKHKITINDFPLFPHYALLSPDLTLGLPAHLTATTGMDTLTHAVEAYLNRGGSKYAKQKAINTVRLIFKHLPTVYNRPLEYEGRKMLQIAAYDGGVAFTRNYVGYIHALSHPLSAYYDLPHGYVNALILPFMLEKYGAKIDRKLASLARASEVVEPGLSARETAAQFIQKIKDLNELFNIPKTIPEIMIEHIPQLAKHANAEARPLYPTPVIYKDKELENFYLELKWGRR